MADGKRSVIIGLGETGYSCARYFHAHGLPFEVMDENPSPRLLVRLQEEIPDSIVTCGHLDRARMLRAEQLVVSPGVPLARAEIQDAASAGVRVTGDIDMFSRAAERPIIAITGSNGKSTVTSLVGEIAQACGVRAGVGGNLGPPALDLLQQDSEVYVLEISSFQLETTVSIGAEVAVVLNLSPDHLDRYADEAQYYATKARIYAGCRHAVINAQEQSRYTFPTATTIWTFGAVEPRGEREFGLQRTANGWRLLRGTQLLLESRAMVLRGHHNYLNALAALAIAAAAGWPMDRAVEAVKSYPGLAHRCEAVGEIDGAQYINDSKATNVGAALSALESLGLEQGGRRIILIAGGAGKGADFAPLCEPVGKFVRAAVVMGQEAGRLADTLQGVTRIEQARDLDEAVLAAHALAVEGDLVLLSPACSSLDMFRNFEERGERFRRAVAALGESGGRQA